VAGSPIKRARREAQRSASESSRIAQLMAEPPRHPWEVLLDSVKTHDVLHRVKREEMLAAPDLTAGMLQELDHRATMAMASSRMAIAEKAHEHIALSWEKHLELQGQQLMIASDAIVDGLTATLGPRHAEDLRIWMLEAGRDRLLAEDDDPPELPPLPFRLAIAPAIEGEVLSSNPAVDEATRERLSPRDTARAPNTVDLEDRLPRPCSLRQFSDDELGRRDRAALPKQEGGRRWLTTGCAPLREDCAGGTTQNRPRKMRGSGARTPAILPR
jgi:hypothetical protein